MKTLSSILFLLLLSFNLEAKELNLENFPVTTALFKPSNTGDSENSWSLFNSSLNLYEQKLDGINAEHILNSYFIEANSNQLLYRFSDKDFYYLRTIKGLDYKPKTSKVLYIHPVSHKIFLLQKKNQKYSVQIEGRKGPWFDYIHFSDFFEDIRQHKSDFSSYYFDDLAYAQKKSFTQSGEDIIYLGCQNTTAKNKSLAGNNCYLVISNSSKDQMIPLNKILKDKKFLVTELGITQKGKQYYLLVQDFNEKKASSGLAYLLINHKLIEAYNISNVEVNSQEDLLVTAFKEKQNVFFINGNSETNAELFKEKKDKILGDLSELKLPGRNPSHFSSAKFLYSYNHSSKMALQLDNSLYGPHFGIRVRNENRSFVNRANEYNQFEYLSEDGQHFAYLADDFNQKQYVIDGKKENKYADVDSFHFLSPDGSKWAYLAEDEKTSTLKPKELCKTEEELKDDPLFVSLKKNCLQNARPIKIPVRKLKLVASNGKHLSLPDLGEMEVELFTSPSKKPLVWIRGKSLQEASNREVPVSTILSKNAENFFENYILPGQAIQFSPDEKKMAYLALKGNELWWIVSNN